MPTTRTTTARTIPAARTIRYGATGTALGWLLVAASERGVCNVRLGAGLSELEVGLRAEFPFAVLERDDAALAPWCSALARCALGLPPGLGVPLDVPASRFRRRVFAALCRIPSGGTRTYAQLAASLGRPGAARAVGRACAANPVALLVPCHRVVPAAGGVGGYRWGAERKRALLRAEAAREGSRARPCSGPAAPR
jgi:AraC family transcriptional regulator of adaptative response/methylated-DNA-[protein]-cysteine methyltransferase